MNKLFSVFALGLIGATIFTSCSKDDSEDNTLLVEQVWKVAQANPDGFTLDLRDLSSPKQGISVAYAETQNSFGKESLSKVIAHAKSHANYVGGWLEETDSTSLYYFDSDTLFSEKDLDAAKAFGKQQGQISIYIISKDSTVYLNSQTSAK